MRHCVKQLCRLGSRRKESPLLRSSRDFLTNATPTCAAATSLWVPTRAYSSGDTFFVDDAEALQSELANVLEGEDAISSEALLARAMPKIDVSSETSRVQLEKLDKPPGRFDLLTNSLAYRWQTTAADARKISGPMREWATELRFRTGVHIELEPTHPERLLLSPEEGGYAVADEVEITVYLFGSERGIFNCHKLMEAAVGQDPAYVRLGVFRRIPGGGPGNVEWLMLRRINRDMRPPDIPPISLKLPGKWTLMYEHYKEAAIRTLWEETGITVEPVKVFPTARLEQNLPVFYWRVPVYYFCAEVPYDVEVLGPQVLQNSYMREWDPKLLRQSPDPIDRAWAQHADPDTGCGWVRAPLIDELQRSLRGDDYMAVRYTPPPYSELASVLGFPEGASPASGGDGTADAVAGAAVALETASAVAVEAAEGGATASTADEKAGKEKKAVSDNEGMVVDGAASDVGQSSDAADTVDRVDASSDGDSSNN